MATVQLNSGRQNFYKSPYSSVSTYNQDSIRDQRQIEVSDNVRSNESPAHNPTSSRYPVGVEQTAMSNGFQKTQAPDRRRKSDTFEGQEEVAIRLSPDSDDDDFPDIDELLSGIPQKSGPASADSNGNNNDGFIDIDDFLSDTYQNCVPSNAVSKCSGMVETVDSGIRHGSLSNSSRSTAASSPDLIILSDDESAATESETETDCSGLDVNFRAKGDAERPHVAGSELEFPAGSGVGVALLPDCLATGHQDNENHNAADKTQPCFSADRLISASLESGPNAPHASRLQVIADSTQQSTSSSNLDGAKQVDDEGCEGNIQNNYDTHSAKRSDLPARSDENPPFDDTVSELQHSQVAHTQALQLGPASTPSHQSTLNNDERLGRGAARIVRSKRPHHEMDDDGSADDRDDHDYADMSDATSSSRGGRRHSRKRTKDMEHNDVESPCTPSLAASCQSAVATSSSSMHESEEMPVHGYFTLKTVGSKVVYCLTFSQELLPRPQHRGQRQDSPTDLGKSQSAVPDSGICQASLQRQRRTWIPWTGEEDAMLLKMKKDGHSWEEIHAALPHRSKETMQVRYSKRLKNQR